MKKYLNFILIVIVTLVIILLGSMDIFSHGYYCDTVDYSEVEGDIVNYIPLSEQYYEMNFIPQKKHFKGFEIILSNQPEHNNGELILTILNKNGKIVEEITVELENVIENKWYFLYSSKNLKVGQVYTLRIEAQNCDTYPELILVDDDYLGDESKESNLLIGYAYAESTFSFAEKIILTIFIISLAFFILSVINRESKFAKYLKYIFVFLCLTGVLTWNYMYNSMDKTNDTFDDFSAGSEALVTGVLEANNKGVQWDFENGLARYTDSSGVWISDEHEFLTFEECWMNGYSKVAPEIVVCSNEYTQTVAQIGNYVSFSNGDILEITDIRDDGQNRVICFKIDEILTESKYGSLNEIKYYDAEYNELPAGMVGGYGGQLGLQGKVFQHMAYRMNYSTVVDNLHLLCSLAAAIVFVIIVFLLFKKDGLLMATCFYVTFWLSPWVVNFARNLYWVEFTWFIPMAIGLFCSIKIADRKYRIGSYFACYFAIVMKSLCGYEFLPVIMLGMISFLLVDFLVAVWNKDKVKSKLLFRTIFILGVLAVLGFLTAICFHARIVGQGNMFDGIKNIYENGALRRTQGADYNKFGVEYWDSFNASIWNVLCLYFQFDTSIITGISGNLFGLMCIAPLGIWGYKFLKNNQIDKQDVLLYFIFGMTCVSWYVLGKAHAYNHQHFCYVLWYFGFIQICFYIIIRNIIEFIRK